MSESIVAGGHAAELQRAFDRSFAEAPRETNVAIFDLLAIEVAGDPYALALSEVAGLSVDRAITPLPTPVPELLGLAGFRATLVPVYDLRALLGYSGRGAPRWIVTLAGEAPLGLAFDRFEAHARVPLAALTALTAEDGRPRSHVQRIVRTDRGVRPLIHLPSVLAAVKARAEAFLRPKER